MKLTVESPTIVSINTPSDICLGTDNVNIITNPTGGTLTGIGVTNNQFNSNTTGIILNTPNILTYTFTNPFGCTSTSTTSITVRQVPKVTQESTNTTICAGKSTSLSVKGTGYTVLEWTRQNENVVLGTGENYITSIAGSYVVKASNNWCSSVSDVGTVTIVTPKVVAVAELMTIKQGEEIRIFVENPVTSQNYIWSTSPSGASGDGVSETSMLIAPSQTTIYTVKLTVDDDPDCTVSDQIEITVVKEPLPDQIFSPGNDDGINDFWRIQNLNAESYPNSIVKVYNRWGSLVYQTRGYDYDGTGDPNATNKKWDGRQDGELLPVGVYYYVIELNDENAKVIDGSVTILR